jgi:hypothetical protein
VFTPLREIRTYRSSPTRAASRNRLALPGLRTAAALAATVCLGLGAFGTPASSATSPVRVTMVGDSVAASLSYVTSARATLDRGINMRYDLRVCRRLVAPSCPYEGVAPPTALQAVESYGHSLGDVLIMDVGYNDSSQGYGRGLDQIMRAALARGVTHVIWVTLRESGQYAALYHSTNAVIQAATARWPELVVADWNDFSAGKPWFGTDGLHLSPAGATELASFLRPFVSRAVTVMHTKHSHG